MDAARPRNERRADGELCDNGVDDDGDGRIDEGCLCLPNESQRCFSGALASRAVGVCRDGVQRCIAQGNVEFGEWGACEGAVLPSAEQCDGMDHDCNGVADDTGTCSCRAGDTQPCGSTLASPCRRGVSTCGADGRWGACVGAVSPSADRCGDLVDNDCDGVVDNGCALLDAGVPSDGAAMDSSPIVDAQVRDAADAANVTDAMTSTDVVTPRPTQCYRALGATAEIGRFAKLPMNVLMYGEAYASNDTELAFAYQRSFVVVDAMGRLLRQTTPIEHPSSTLLQDMKWTGTHWALAWTEQSSTTSYVQLIDRNGVAVGTKVNIDPTAARTNAVRLVIRGGELLVFYTVHEGASVPYVPSINSRRFSLSLAPLSARAQHITDALATGLFAATDRGVIGGFYHPSMLQYGWVGTFNGERPVEWRLLGRRATPSGQMTGLDSVVASNGAESMVMWNVFGDRDGFSGPYVRTRFQRIDSAGATIGPFIEAAGEREVGANFKDNGIGIALGANGYWFLDATHDSAMGEGQIRQLAQDGTIVFDLALNSRPILPTNWHGGLLGDCVVLLGHGAVFQRMPDSAVDSYVFTRRVCAASCP